MRLELRLKKAEQLLAEFQESYHRSGKKPDGISYALGRTLVLAAFTDPCHFPHKQLLYLQGLWDHAKAPYSIYDVVRNAKSDILYTFFLPRELVGSLAWTKQHSQLSAMAGISLHNRELAKLL